MKLNVFVLYIDYTKKHVLAFKFGITMWLVSMAGTASLWMWCN